MVPCHDRPQRRDESGAGDRPWSSPVPEIRLHLPADWLAPSIARDRLRRWLVALRWSPDEAEDIVLVASEAISNSVEHGYRVPRAGVGHPGVVEVIGSVVGDGGHRHLRLEVRDRGAWRPPGQGRPLRNGVALMRALMADVEIDGDERGTTVVLTSRPG